MKILFADQFSEFGGAQRVLSEVLDEVVRRGWLAQVMAPGSGPLLAACTARGIPALPLPFNRYSNGHKTATDVFRYTIDSARAMFAIRDAARRFQPDLIYVNGPRVLPAAVLAARTLQTPIIFHTHSYLKRGYARSIADWCVKQENVRVVAISRFVARPFDGAAGARTRIIYNGVRDHGFLPCPRAKPQCIGIVGRVSPEKGHADFVSTARIMAATRPGLRFVVFGAAQFSDSAFEREVRAAAGACVEFRGWADDVSPALHEIDVLAVPSGPGEGATRVIMEAFSAGTPVVAYPSGGIPELVRHGDTGFLTCARGERHLAGGLGELLDDPALMQRLSLNGRREWDTRFRLDRFQSEIRDFIAGAQTTSGFRCELPAPESASGIARGAR